MKLYINEETFAYELENVARMFSRSLKVERLEALSEESEAAFEGDFCAARREETGAASVLFAAARLAGRSASDSLSLGPGATVKETELALARLLYGVLSKLYGFKPEWGVITGIRPAKFVSKMLENMSEAEVISSLCGKYYVSERKARLCVETARSCAKLEKLNTPRSFSLYVSIPFCPTRCSYCSFVSKTVERDRALVEPYVEKLCGELAFCGEVVRSLGLRLESVYIGGGTPTTLEAGQLERLCAAIAQNFELESSREFSVEAGRPDTITPEKLAVLKKAGVTRLSINPQTKSERVLHAIGRRHSAADIERAFSEAREAGFDNINADLIAGLPLDTLEGFRASLDWVLGLEAENITVHALTLKRASYLGEEGGQASSEAAASVSWANDLLPRRGYVPYYMYKQKGTADCLENTGYALPGRECLYNVYIMEEVHTILACGAGAVTKLVNQKSGLISRVFNYKYPAEYIDGFEKLLERKKEMIEFYGDIQP
ncbi:MAG: coproporphyrinogen dehydrogenase HemZ [Oscillospiraceae bacterium]|nr:coproporphyrinogen dehydrogenase HemZ [Oscillospiraceae bacterium]